MAWIEPVNNRTSAVKYNETDLNRVGNNMQYLADLLNSYGYKVRIQPKTDWLAADIPTQPQMAQLLADLQALQDAYYTLNSTPEQPASMNNLRFTGANHIEQILLDIRTVITRMEKGYRYCGTFYCGQEVVLP